MSEYRNEHHFYGVSRFRGGLTAERLAAAGVSLSVEPAGVSPWELEKELERHFQNHADFVSANTKIWAGKPDRAELISRYRAALETIKQAERALSTAEILDFGPEPAEPEPDEYETSEGVYSR